VATSSAPTEMYKSFKFEITIFSAVLFSVIKIPIKQPTKDPNN